MPNSGFDLNAAAHDEMIHEGFTPDFAPGTEEQIVALRHRPTLAASDGVKDLREMLWSSIDNDTSRDLDQIEVAERVEGGIRVMVGIADVDSALGIGTPIDQHASSQTTSVYTTVRTFPMLPEELSTDLTSLNEAGDRMAIVIEFVVGPTGEFVSTDGAGGVIYRALVRNKAQLTYNAVGSWLEGKGAAPPKVAASAELAAQLKLQDEAALALRAQRHRLGALEFDRAEAHAVINDGRVHDFAASPKTRANDLIEDFMVAANEVMARTLKEKGRSAIRRVVKTPERWPRIVELARQCGDSLPEQPDSGALSAFLQRRRAADPVHYPDLSLSVVKLMGPGEYVLSRPSDDDQGHFGLATHDYTHSTAPNRRFADLVTQRLIKATWAGQPSPYSDGQLDGIARNCTLKEDAARKVERTMMKRVAAVALKDRVGETFAAVVTGVTPKGVFVRVPQPPVEGRVMRGEEGMDVGDQVQVRLLHTDPQRGFIDFGRA
jgi:VacB/RNase II family 3'-5' exoribonuclease